MHQKLSFSIACLFILLTSYIGFSQTSTVLFTVSNMVQTNANTFEFDVYCTNTGTTSLSLRGYSFGLNLTSGLSNGGTIGYTFLNRAAALSTLPNVSAFYFSGTNHLRASTTNAATGNAVAIVNGSPVRLATMRVMTTASTFPANFNPFLPTSPLQAVQVLNSTNRTQCVAVVIITPPGTTYAINGTANAPSIDTLNGLTAVMSPSPVSSTPFLLNPPCIPSITNINVTSCYSYTWSVSSQTYTASGIYSKATAQTSQPACHDTAYLHLTINHSTSSSFSASACDLYTWVTNNQTYSLSGIYTATILNTAGCDSIRTLNLTMNHNTGSSFITACNSYTWEGNTYTTNGSPTHTYTNVAGCDSIHTLNLSVNYSNTGSSSVTACNSYNWEGNTYTASATPTHTYINVSGCDSVHTLNLTIHPITSNTVTISALDSYQWSTNNQTYTATGVYTFTSVNSFGCDSIIVLNLTILQASVTMTLQNVVQISPGVFEYDVMLINTGNTTLALKGYSCGINHAAGMRNGGTLTHTYISRDPLLSTIPVPVPGYTASNNHLRFIAANSTIGNEVTLLSGIPIRIATMRVTNSVAFPTNFIPDFNLQTLTAIGKTQSIATCIVTPPGTNFNINGTGNTSATGTIQGLTGVVNTPCLYLNPSSSFLSTVSQTTAVVCYGQSNGTAQINLSGTGSTSPFGNYTVDGGTGIAYSTNPFTVSNLSAGTHTIIVATSYGCTHSTLATITQPAIISTSSSVTTCDSYIWEGATYTTSGTPSHIYQSYSGCDSIHILNLTISHSNIGSSVVTACNSYLWNGNSYTTSGIYTQSFTNFEACDSLHSLNLTINYSSTSSIIIGSCDSYSWNGNSYSSSGVYTQTYSNIEGCDSMASLNLNINNVHIQQNDTTICAGASITLNATSTSSTNNLPSNLQTGLVAWYPFNGNPNDESGNGNNGTNNGATLTTDRFNNVNSAYSFDGSSSFINVSDPANNSLDFMGSPFSIAVWIKSSQNSYAPIVNKQNLALSNESGDYNLDINVPYGVARLAMGFGSGNGASVESVSQVNTDTWIHIVAVYNAPSSMDIYVNGVHNSNVCNACNLAPLNLLNSPQSMRFGKGWYSLFNGKLDDIGIWNRLLTEQEIQQLYSNISYQWSTGATTSSINVSPTQTNTYYLTTSNSGNSCTDSVTVTVNNPSVNAGTNQSVCQGDSVTLTATGASTYVWSNNVINGQSFIPLSTQTYTVTGTNSLGCTATSPVTLTVNPKPSPYIITSGATTFCDGNSVVVNANTGNGLTYKWFKDGIEINGATLGSYTATQSGSYVVEEKNISNCMAISTPQIVTVNNCNVDLHLKLFYQGYCAGATTMPPVLLNQGMSNDSSITDTILIELHSPLPPYGLVLSKQAILHTNGNADCTFNYTNGNYYLADSYYVAVKHRNGLTTWSSIAVAFSSTSVFYDFSTSSDKAYGDNMYLVEPGMWAFYTGELNDDDNIDLLDNPILEDGVSTFQFGYYAADLNGDGNVDLLDYPTLDTNIYGFIFSYQPTWNGSLPTVSTTTVSSIVTGTAVSGGNVISDGGVPITARGVCWSMNPHPTIGDSITNNGIGNGSFTSGITSLNPNTTYYVRAYATNSVGTVYGNEVSFVSGSLAIGQSYQGGKVAYIFQPGDLGYINGEVHGLIAAPSDQGVVEWGCIGTFVGGTYTNIGSGQSNTNSIIVGCPVINIAASLCNDFILNGFSDWYLPSRDELDQLYNNRNAIGGFFNNYWSSSEGNSISVWVKGFNNGGQSGYNNKNAVSNSVRAIRSF